MNESIKKALSFLFLAFLLPFVSNQKSHANVAFHSEKTNSITINSTTKHDSKNTNIVSNNASDVEFNGKRSQPIIIITSSLSDSYTCEATITSMGVPVSSSLSGCIGGGAQWTGSGTPATSNAWVSSNSSVVKLSSMGTSQFVSYLSAGTANVTYTNSQGCSKTLAVTVVANPAAPSTSPVSYCVGATASPLTATAATGNTLKWYAPVFINGNTFYQPVSSAPTPSTATAGSITYQVAQVNASGCETLQNSRANLVVTIANPSVSVGTIADVTTEATSFNITFSNASAGLDKYSIAAGSSSPMPGFTAVSNQALPTNGTITVVIPRSAAGTYNFKLTVINSTTGCSEEYNGSLNVIAANAPVIVTSGILNAFSACVGSVSSVQNFTISGSNLTNNITITAPTGYQVSTTLTASDFTNTLTLAHSGGTVAEKTIYVRMNTSTNGLSGNITCVSTGASTKNIATGTGVVNALPTMNIGGGGPPGPTASVCFADQNINASTQATTASSNPWVSSNTGIFTISYPMSGNTKLIKITPVSLGTANLTLTDNNGCVGVTAVTVKPTPTITGNLSSCAGGIPVAMTATGASGTTSWQISNGNNFASINPSTGVLTPLANGTATVQVTVNGCPKSESFIVEPVAITVGTVADVTTAETSFSIPYVASTGGANKYSITATGATPMPGFVNVSNANLGASPIAVVMPASSVGTYTFAITFSNSSTGCSSSSYNFTVGVVSASVPRITTSGTISTFAACSGLPSPAQTINVSGANLTADITITAPTGYEASLSSTSGYTSSVTVSKDANGIAASTPIFLRLKVGVAAGTSGNFTFISSGAVTKTLATGNSGLNPLPSISILGGTSAETCVNAVLSLQANNTPATNNPWISSNTQIATLSTNTQNPSFITVNGLTAGTTNITYTDNKGCIATQAFRVNALPTITGGTVVCLGSTLQLSGNGTPNSTNPWNSTNQTVATISDDGLVTGLTVGTSNITYRNNDGCSKTQIITVNPKPSTPSIVAGGATTFCAGESVVLTSSSTTGNQWYKDGAAINSATAATFTATTSGSYTVIVTSAEGCSSAASAATTVTANPLPAAPVVSNTAYCIGSTTSALTATALSGNTLGWYGTNATGGTASSTPPTPSASAAGSTDYYVSQISAQGCESARSKITVVVNDLPAAPVVSNLAYCVGSTTTALSATANSGHTLSWYGTNATGGTASITPPTPSSAAAGSTDYYVSQVSAEGCESARSKITVVVNDLPAAPVVSNLAYCVGSTTTALSATALTGNTLSWYGTNATGGTASSTPPTPSSSAAGTTDFYVSQINAQGCESARSKITVTVNARPAAPVVSNLAYCVGSTTTALSATALTGNTLRWYGTNATGGTASNTPPTPSSSAAGTTDFYVSQINALGCESIRSKISVVVNALPAAPVVSNLAYCIASTTTALSATALTGNTLSWYGTNATGGTASSTPPTPSASATGTTDYYVSQISAEGCESARSKITVTVNALPAAPVVSNLAYCAGSTTSALTATALSSHTLSWYGTNATGGTASSTAPTPSSAAAGTTDYYVSQISALGCESARSKITVVVNALPAAPVVSNLAYCVGSTTSALSATALTGNTLRWYGTNATGGTASSTAPTPSSAAAGTTDFYVSQINALGCESIRSKITVVVNALPAAPVVSNSTYCIGSTTTALSATALSGNTLRWYGTNATGGTASSTPPTPSASATGTTDYYVSQINSLGCESIRGVIKHIVNPLPAKPVISWSGVQFSTTASGVNYQWLLNGAAISGATASTHKPLNTGDFKLRITDPNGCINVSDSFKLVVTAISNLVATPASNIAMVYPNPASTQLVLEFATLPTINLNFQLVSPSGKILSSTNGRNKVNVIDVSKLESGNYFIRVVGKKYDQVKKVLIKK
jgi:hypothetical protein